MVQGHAHNDYRHGRPLLDALAYGFTSIEVDIILRDGDLFVAHAVEEIDPLRTLRGLYLDPLRERASRNGGPIYPGGPQVMLLIDVKSDAATTYRKLDGVLAEYSDVFTSFGPDGSRSDKGVLAVISGNRPAVSLMAAQTVRYAAYDGRLEDLDSDAPPDLMPLISDRWTQHFKWMGVGTMPKEEQDRLHRIVQLSHTKRRRVRFWATADNQSCRRNALWSALISAGVDLINTDDLGGLQHFVLSE